MVGEASSDWDKYSSKLFSPLAPVEGGGDLEREVVVGVDNVRHDDVAVPQALPRVHAVGVLVGQADLVSCRQVTDVASCLLRLVQSSAKTWPNWGFHVYYVIIPGWQRMTIPRF